MVGELASSVFAELETQSSDPSMSLLGALLGDAVIGMLLQWRFLEVWARKQKIQQNVVGRRSPVICRDFSLIVVKM